MSVPCPGCGREYDVTLFQFGRTIHCTCGSRVRMEPRVRDTGTGGEPRFLLDAMLGRLARWLRLAGLDAAYEAHVDDRDLVRRALEEDRVILTRDRRLEEEWSLPRILVLDSEAPREQLRQVVRTWDLDRPPQPFTRCSLCNTELEPLSRREAARLSVPPRVLLANRRFRRCPSCGRAYWDGSHVDRMRRTLEAIFAR